jgi:hypothetical protein
MAFWATNRGFLLQALQSFTQGGIDLFHHAIPEREEAWSNHLVH